ncbi:hypothetical protein MesoLj113a_72680 [Mesorhizobium sp. 113-1-2]|nr:hypothetical protein MesoLj113a_72680 [Mesorhizobium sp. 113-1-2]
MLATERAAPSATADDATRIVMVVAIGKLVHAAPCREASPKKERYHCSERPEGGIFRNTPALDDMTMTTMLGSRR